MGVPAIVTAGDRQSAKAVYGESKVYLEVEGVSLVARVVQVLQHVPEVTEVWVIGNAERLGAVLGGDDALCAVARREGDLEPHPPPGMDEVVTQR